MAKSLRRIALVVAVATALSKVAGLVRQTVIAAAFGVGIVYDAYNYAYVLPGFLLVLLGGINGPFHSAMVSVLARRPREEGAHVLATINTLVGVGLLGVTLLLVVAADPLITLVGPGLDGPRHAIAVLELRWMAPMALLAGPIVGLVYERGAFDVHAARLVGGLLMAYGVGMPAYLGRDVLVRVFYALGDGTTPFRFSMAGIGLNVVFDWTLVGGPTPWGLQLPALNFGAPGLVLATVAVNVITCLLLLLALQARLGGLPLRLWGRDSLLLLGSAVLGGLVAWGLSSAITWPMGLPGKLLNCGLSGGLGLGVYGLLASAAGVQEARQFTVQIRRQLAQRLKFRR